MESLVLIILVIISLAILLETTYLAAKFAPKGILKKSIPRRRVFIDTSALIDGRLAAIAKIGFLGDDLIIPRSVVRELQLLADGKDAERRSRARSGLDHVNEMEKMELAHVTIYDDPLDRTPVDERLIELAHKEHGLILTNDYNLNMVANTEDIDVLNINDLALAVRQEYLPGETFHLKITTVGNNPKQGVGHLPDGTMVVVDNASKKINEEVDVQFIRYLQTSSGRMMFAKMTTIPKSKRQPMIKRKKRKDPKDAKDAKDSKESKEPKEPKEEPLPEGIVDL